MLNVMKLAADVYLKTNGAEAEQLTQPLQLKKFRSHWTVLPEPTKFGWDDIDLSIFGHKSLAATEYLNHFKDARIAPWLFVGKYL